MSETFREANARNERYQERVVASYLYNKDPVKYHFCANGKIGTEKPMSYTRVIPRDLFNESKLLKCLGQLSLLIHDGKTGGLPLLLEHDDSVCPGFDIQQDGDRAMFFCSNLSLTIAGLEIMVGVPINARSRYPMEMLTDDKGDIPLFDDDGKLSAEFYEYWEARRRD